LQAKLTRLVVNLRPHHRRIGADRVIVDKRAYWSAPGVCNPRREKPTKEISMTLEKLRAEAAKLFPIAVANAVDRPADDNPELLSLKQLAWKHYKSLDFSCMAACFDAIMPRSEGELNVAGWSSTEMSVLPWTFRVSCRPFYLSSSSAHFEIRHDGPLPGVTETGYRSIFAPMTKFADTTLADFIRSEICRDLPKSAQMDLF
jgi:hypothetical protein